MGNSKISKKYIRKILTFNIPTKKTTLIIKKLCAKRNTSVTYEKKEYQQKNRRRVMHTCKVTFECYRGETWHKVKFKFHLTLKIRNRILDGLLHHTAQM